MRERVKGECPCHNSFLVSDHFSIWPFEKQVTDLVEDKRTDSSYCRNEWIHLKLKPLFHIFEIITLPPPPRPQCLDSL